MNNSASNNYIDTLARVISVVFHPLVIPVYGMAIILSAPALFGYLPSAVKRLLFLIVLVNNVLLPVSLIPFFIHRNIISSWTIESRRERIIPLIITTILYSVTAFIISRLPIPVFLKSFILAASFISLVVTIINLWWKISIHAVGAGALIAIVLTLSFKMYVPLISYLIPAIIIAGLLLSSRLRLNFHNPHQVWFGFLTGFLGLSLIMILF